MTFENFYCKQKKNKATMAQHKRRWDANPDGEEDGPPVGNAQVLPVAQLPDDWEGEPMDGATYLALGQ